MSHSVAFSVMYLFRHETGLRRFLEVVSNPLISLVRRFVAAVRAVVCGGVRRRHCLLVRRFCGGGVGGVPPYPPVRAYTRARGTRGAMRRGSSMRPRIESIPGPPVVHIPAQPTRQERLAKARRPNNPVTTSAAETR